MKSIREFDVENTITNILQDSTLKFSNPDRTQLNDTYAAQNKKFNLDKEHYLNVIENSVLFHQLNPAQQ